MLGLDTSSVVLRRFAGGGDASGLAFRAGLGLGFGVGAAVVLASLLTALILLEGLTEAGATDGGAGLAPDSPDFTRGFDRGRFWLEILNKLLSLAAITHIVNIGPDDLMARKILLVSENGGIQDLPAHVFTGVFWLHLFSDHRTLFTKSAEVPLLPVKMDVVISVICSGEWFVTELVFVPSRSIMHILVCLPSPAFLRHGVATKPVVSAGLGNTMSLKLQVIPGARRSQDEGSVEVKVVVFELIIVGQAHVVLYLWRILAVAEGCSEVVATVEKLESALRVQAD